MKSNDWKINKGMFLQLFFVVSVVGSTMLFCHSCTRPDVVYAAEGRITDSTQSIVIKGPICTEKKEAEKPDLILEQGDSIYHLVSTELTEVLVEGMMTYVSASVPYELEWQQKPPETTMVTLYDERSNREYKRELTCLDMKETEVLWEKNFSFPITVSGYDAENFQLGNVLISKDEELIHYADHILESMGLSKEHYRIKTITWRGEAYEREGEVFREALAEGEKQIRRVDVTYGGEIKTPDMIGYQYTSIYEIPEKKEDIRKSTNISDTKAYVEEANISRSKGGFAEHVRRVLQEHMTIVTMSGLFILFISGMVYFWRISKKRTKKQKSKELT